jgi:hypothetical protein
MAFPENDFAIETSHLLAFKFKYHTALFVQACKVLGYHIGCHMRMSHEVFGY